MSESDVKDLIVNSARMHFSRYGFHKTTMDEIAKHIHKAKGVLYYYFSSKEDLFNEVVRQELANVKAELSKITTSNVDSLTIIKRYFLTRLKLLSTAVNYHETLKADFFEKYHFVKDVRDDFAAFEHEQLTLILTNGIKEGYLEIKNVTSTVEAVLMLVSSIELPLYLQNKYAEYEKVIVDLVSMILNSLRSYKK
jgi:AcrR family transcriptional regulator